MTDPGHEGPTFTRRYIADLARKVYDRHREEVIKRDRWAKPLPWPALPRVERALWTLEVHTVMLGGETQNHRAPWERELIFQVAREKG